MITLVQDNDGFIRMERHFPLSATIRIRFSDGSSGVFTGARVNRAYDDAVAEFRAGNHLDAKGFSRTPKRPRNSKINAVRVSPDMGD